MTKRDDGWSNFANQFTRRMSIKDLNVYVMERLDSIVRKSKWIISCSGGIDSLGLLFLVYTMFPSQRSLLTIAFFNHKTRPESKNESKFILMVALKLKIAIYTGAPSRLFSKISENSMRVARLNFIKNISQINQSYIVLQGHQKNDIAESLLMRLSRGSGINGLISTKEIHVHDSGIIYIRPMTAIAKNKIVCFMQKIGTSWSKDHSNDQDIFYRNFIRIRILPKWSKVVSGCLVSSIVNSYNLLKEDYDALESWIEHTRCRIDSGQSLNCIWVKKPRSFIRRVICKWLNLNGLCLFIKRPMSELLLNLTVEGRTGEFSVSGKKEIGIRNSTLIIRNRKSFQEFWELKELIPEVNIKLPDQSTSRIEIIKSDCFIYKNISKGKINSNYEAFLDFGGMDYKKISIRVWKYGDLYRQINTYKNNKIKNLFVDKKINRSIRKLLPIYCLADEPIWVPGFSPIHNNRITRLASYILKLNYNPCGRNIFS